VAAAKIARFIEFEPGRDNFYKANSNNFFRDRKWYGFVEPPSTYTLTLVSGCAMNSLSSVPHWNPMCGQSSPSSFCLW
jgi:hypothetical protein